MSEQTNRRRIPLLAVVVVLVAVVGIVSALVSLYSGPALSSADASATAEARQFATAEVARQATSVSVRRTSTASARATGTALAIARSTREVESTATTEAQAISTSTAAAVASAIAPATQTARATSFEERRAEAEAAARRLDAEATLVFGPSSGTLNHDLIGVPTCAKTDLALHNFIASARIYNSASNSAADPSFPWDHGIAFTNIGEDTAFVMSIRSSGDYAFRLTGPAFYIETNNSSDLLDVSRPGDNHIKLYFEEDVVYIFLNGLYADTIDVRHMGFGQSDAFDHSPQLCSNLDEPDAHDPPTTRYADFTVWEVR